MKKNYNIFDAALNPDASARLEETGAEVRAMLEIAGIFHDIMTDEGLLKKELAEKLGVSPGYVSRILAGDENLSIGNVARLLHRLGRSYHQHAGKKNGTKYSLIESSRGMESEITITSSTQGVKKSNWGAAVRHDLSFTANRIEVKG